MKIHLLKENIYGHVPAQQKRRRVGGVASHHSPVVICAVILQGNLR